MSKRYIVTVTDTEGVVWLNTGSFEADKDILVSLIENSIRKAKEDDRVCTFCHKHLRECEARGY